MLAITSKSVCPAGRVGSMLAMALLTSVGAVAQFTTIRLHPEDAEQSQVFGLEGRHQVGVIHSTSGPTGAAIWEGSPDSVTILHPDGFDYSRINSVSDGVQVGEVFVGQTGRAALWRGTKRSFVQLGGPNSYAHSIRKGVIAGGSEYTSAGFWTLPDLQFTALPVPSQAYGTDGHAIAGWSYPNGATLWFVDGSAPVALFPMQNGSTAYATDGEQQVGSYLYRAAIWHYAFPNSYVDLGPIGVTDAKAVSVHKGIQVGWVYPYGQHWQASLWRGTRESRVHLHALLPPGAELSQATSVWVDEHEIIYIGGWAEYGGRRQAFMWVSDTLLAQGFEIIRGVATAGNLMSLKHSDNDHLALRPGPVFTSTQSPINITIDGFAPANNPSELRFSVESHGNAGNILQGVSLFNFENNLYEELDTATLTTVDNTRQVTINKAADRFIEPEFRRMRARLTYRAQGPTFVYPWEIRIDRTWWGHAG